MNDTSDRMDLAQSWEEVVGALAATQVSFTVPQGERWRLVHCWTSQNDAARNCYWQITRDGHTLVITESAASAANVRVFFYNQCVIKETLILRFGDVLTVVYDGMAAGKQATIFALVETRSGETA
jgi:hypothetical protein